MNGRSMRIGVSHHKSTRILHSSTQTRLHTTKDTPYTEKKKHTLRDTLTLLRQRWSCGTHRASRPRSACEPSTGWVTTLRRSLHSRSTSAVTSVVPPLFASRIGVRTCVLQLPPRADRSSVVSLDDPYLRVKRPR